MIESLGHRRRQRIVENKAVNTRHSVALVCSRCFFLSYSHGGVGQLLLGEVEGVVGHRDAIDARVLSCRKISPQDSVAADAEEGHQAVPRHIVEPHLPKQKGH